MVLAQLIYIYSLPQNYQNTQLFRDIETGRAKMKAIRISYPEPKQSTSTSTHYRRVLKTHCFSVILKPGGLK